jgi:hypothetical protein
MLEEVYTKYLSGLDSRFCPRFVSLTETNGLLKLTVSETFQNHSIETTFTYVLLNDGSVEPQPDDVVYETDSSEDSVFSLNSFDTSDHRDNPIIRSIVTKRDMSARKWTYMVPLEDWCFANRISARPTDDSESVQ